LVSWVSVLRGITAAAANKLSLKGLNLDYCFGVTLQKIPLFYVLVRTLTKAQKKRTLGTLNLKAKISHCIALLLNIVLKLRHWPQNW
jgi:hypothetical protein